MSNNFYNHLATYDAHGRPLEAVREYVNPHTNAVAEKEAFAWDLAYDAMWRVKVLFNEQRIKGNLAEILRSFGESVGDLAHDWAGQWEDGGTDYS